MMKAIVRYNYGGPEAIEVVDLPKPEPKNHEVLVKVKCTTVNRTDCGVLSGMPFVFRFFIGLTKPKRIVLGTDFAGEIIAVGAHVTNFKVGQHVFGFNDEGASTQAEYMVFDANGALAEIPEGITYPQAAASAEATHYAINFINKVKLNPQHRVFVNGGTGAIGSAAIQFLKYQGIYVVATAPTNLVQTVKNLGADEVIDYQTEDFTKLNQTFDFVFDAVGKSRFKACKPIMKSKSAYLSSELGPKAENIFLPIFTLFSGKRVIFPVPTQGKKSILFTQKLLAERKFNPLIDCAFTPTQATEAYSYVDAGKKVGNVILNINVEK